MQRYLLPLWCHPFCSGNPVYLLRPSSLLPKAKGQESKLILASPWSTLTQCAHVITAPAVQVLESSKSVNTCNPRARRLASSICSDQVFQRILSVANSIARRPPSPTGKAVRQFAVGREPRCTAAVITCGRGVPRARAGAGPGRTTPAHPTRRPPTCLTVKLTPNERSCPLGGQPCPLLFFGAQ
ncbi:hypothetical protein B0T26DRAFT_440338 [Lasiosphaeria miniovina]|uniref:Uncharacterized protein n=1 Tax=Lasiosphaeria miniovina TaxID=1954250 RepID=A0AA39ZYL3_9PEZI|nr:uncharacterized protein B0T26DRAFT_440338 [Lasiosphaeria miniovina]KAK0706000.1 hypothetical protein B0T26DRAFT_440338 [Lasiosphaeria miniovina]